MNRMQEHLFREAMTALDSGDYPRLRELRQALSPTDREALLTAALGALADRTITEIDTYTEKEN